MKITFTTSSGSLFAKVDNWNDANLITKSIFKRNYWSDLYYDIEFTDGQCINGSIDLEPQCFHRPHQNELFTWHLKTFWTNISNIKLPHFAISENDVKLFTNLLTKLPN